MLAGLAQAVTAGGSDSASGTSDDVVGGGASETLDASTASVASGGGDETLSSSSPSAAADVDSGLCSLTFASPDSCILFHMIVSLRCLGEAVVEDDLSRGESVHVSMCL